MLYYIHLDGHYVRMIKNDFMIKRTNEINNDVSDLSTLSTTTFSWP